jgi:putative RNA 2'-phosphotransferase
MNLVELSKEISYALRHAPWEYELELDEQGFVPIAQLLHALNESNKFEREIVQADLEEIIATSEKKRHEIVGDKIRALYGHTVPQIIKKEPGIPPAVLYHGTTHRALPQILQDGLKPMQRQYVHLSIDVETATRVGKRRDPEPVILKIDTEAAQKAGIQFYIGNDKVWLCNRVPKECITV